MIYNLQKQLKLIQQKLKLQKGGASARAVHFPSEDMLEETHTYEKEEESNRVLKSPKVHSELRKIISKSREENEGLRPLRKYLENPDNYGTFCKFTSLMSGYDSLDINLTAMNRACGAGKLEAVFDGIEALQKKDSFNSADYRGKFNMVNRLIREIASAKAALAHASVPPAYQYTGTMFPPSLFISEGFEMHEISRQKYEAQQKQQEQGSTAAPGSDKKLLHEASYVEKLKQQNQGGMQQPANRRNSSDGGRSQGV